ncbi:MAG: hypothetical protein ACYC3G_02135 [Minisyncoccota bacterium]
MASLVEVCINGGFYSYKLEGPYSLKSGQKEGSSVEALMFSNISYLHKLKHIRDSKLAKGSQPDRLHLHLAWILEAGEFVQSQELCPHCSDEQKKIKFFSVRISGGDYSFGGAQYVSCGGEACMYKLLTDEKIHLWPLKFSSLGHFRNSKQKDAGAFFKELFLGKERLDSEKAFQMFLSSTSKAIQL